MQASTKIIKRNGKAKIGNAIRRLKHKTLFKVKIGIQTNSFK